MNLGQPWPALQHEGSRGLKPDASPRGLDNQSCLRSDREQSKIFLGSKLIFSFLQKQVQRENHSSGTYAIPLTSLAYKSIEGKRFIKNNASIS